MGTKLQRAAIIASDSIDDDHATIARYCIPEFVEIWRETSLLELGRSAEAIDVFHNAIVALPLIYYRDRGNYLGRLGIAYADEVEPRGRLGIRA